MKKRTALFATMMVTLGTAFMNCNTVEAGMFKQVPEPYGIYTITPDCVYNDYTRNDFINSVYLVEVGYCTEDSVNVVIIDAVTLDNETYTLDKSKDSVYMDCDDNAGYVSLDYIAEYSGWYLYLDGTYTCLDPVTWQYSYMPYPGDAPWMNPIGSYLDTDTYDQLFDVYDLYNTGYYVASYVRDESLYRVIVDIEYQEESVIYNIDGLGSIYADDTCYEFYPEYDDGIFIPLEKMQLFSLENLYRFGAIEIDVPYYLNDGECVNVHLEFTYTTDDYGQQLEYTMDSDFWNKPLTGYAIFADSSIIISNDFMLLETDDDMSIIIPSITVNPKTCNWDINEDKLFDF